MCFVVYLFRFSAQHHYWHRGSRVSIAIICIRAIKSKRLKLKSLNFAHRDSQSQYLAHQLILGQKVKGQGHRITKFITSRRDSRAAPSRCGSVVAQRDGPAWPSRRATTQPRRTVLFKAIEWSASVMHSVDCLASI